MDIAALLSAAADGSGEEDFLVSWSSSEHRVKERVTFAEYARRAAVVSRSLGVVHGAPIAMLALPSISYFVVIGAVYHGGGVLVNLSWQQSPSAIARAVDALSPAVLVTSGSLLALSEAARSMADHFPMERVLDTFGQDGLLSSPIPSAGVEGGENSPHTASQDAVAAIYFTPGTTGEPKPVPVMHSGLVWAVKQRLQALGGVEVIARGILSFATATDLPLLVHCFLMSAYARVPMYVHSDGAPNSLSAQVLREAVETLRPSVVETFPRILETIAAASRGDSSFASPFVRTPSGDTHLATGPSWVLYYGAALADSTHGALAELGVPIASQYFQVELGCAVLIGTPGARTGAMRPISGTRCEAILVEDSDMLPALTTASEGEVELVVEGELVVCDCLSATPGVLGQPTPPVSSSVQHRTGDVFVGRRDVDGEWVWTFSRRLEAPLQLLNGQTFFPQAIERSVRRALGTHITYTCAVGTGRVVSLAHSHCKSCPTMSQQSALLLRSMPVVQLPAVFVEERAPGLSTGWDIMAVVDSVNSMLPRELALTKERLLVLPPGSLPVTEVGELMRGGMDELFALELNAVDGLGGSNEERVQSYPVYMDASASSSSIVEGTDKGVRSGVLTKVKPEPAPVADKAAMDILAHMYFLILLCVVHMHLRVPGQTAERSGLLAIDAFQRTFAIPAVFVLLGYGDMNAPTPRALGNVAMITCLVFAVAMAIEFYSPLPRGVAALFKTALPVDPSGDAPLPSAAFFQQHCWFMVVLSIYRLLHALFRSFELPYALPFLAVVLHFGVYGSFLIWPLLRHPYDTIAPWSVVSRAYFGSESFRSWTNTYFPSPGLIVYLTPFLLHYSAIPLLLPRGFPAALPNPSTLSTSHASQMKTRRIWMAILAVIVCLCVVPSVRDYQRDVLELERGATNTSLLQTSEKTAPTLPPRRRALLDDDPAGTAFVRENALGELASSTYLAYSCIFSDSKAIFGTSLRNRRLIEQEQLPERPRNNTDIYEAISPHVSAQLMPYNQWDHLKALISTDITERKQTSDPESNGAAPWCTAPSWSVAALMSDLCGVAVALATIFGVCAACPRKSTFMATLGRRPLAFLLFHIYLIPLFQLPLHGLQRAFVQHLSWAAPIFVVFSQFLCCLLIVFLSAIPLPNADDLRQAKSRITHQLDMLWRCGPAAQKAVREFKPRFKSATKDKAGGAPATEATTLLDRAV